MLCIESCTLLAWILDYIFLERNYTPAKQESGVNLGILNSYIGVI